MEARKEVLQELRDVVDLLKSDEMRATSKMLGQELYLRGRWILGAILHPVATFQAVMLIGDQETINRNVKRALSLPRLPIGRERFQG